MLEVWRSGGAFQAEGLEPETGEPDTTAANLHALFCPERTILAILNHGGNLLFVFKNGEVYFARGFKLDSPQLARFLVEHTDGDWTSGFETMLSMLSTWPVDLDGPVHLPR